MIESEYMTDDYFWYLVDSCSSAEELVYRANQELGIDICMDDAIALMEGEDMNGKNWNWQAGYTRWRFTCPHHGNVMGWYKNGKITCPACDYTTDFDPWKEYFR